MERHILIGMMFLTLAAPAMGQQICDKPVHPTLRKYCAAGCDIAKFAAVRRAAQDLNSATSVGVNYDQYGPLVRRLVTEAALLPSRQSDKEDQLRNLYLDAEAFHKAALKILNEKYDDPGSHPAQLVELEMQEFWKRAKNAVDKAEVLLRKCEEKKSVSKKSRAE